MKVLTTALNPLPEIQPGDDLAQIIKDALGDIQIQSADVLVIAHKAISKAEGQIRVLNDVQPNSDAEKLADQQNKDPRLVQVILDESAQILRAEHEVIISVTHHGFVCANAGVDASNSDEGSVILLPKDPDASAARLRNALHQLLGVAPAIVITDSFGRAWRRGQCDIAIGCAGLIPLDDWRSRHDANGRPLQATQLAVADQVAAAADLARTKASKQPVVLVRGLGRFVGQNYPGAKELIRDPDEDLFR